MPMLLVVAGVGLLGLCLPLGFVAVLAASLFADRARALGYEVERNCQPLALFLIGWPATFNLLDSEERLSHKDRTLRALFLTVAWVNRVIVVALLVAIGAGVAGFVLSG